MTPTEPWRLCSETRSLVVVTGSKDTPLKVLSAAGQALGFGTVHQRAAVPVVDHPRGGQPDAAAVVEEVDRAAVRGDRLAPVRLDPLRPGLRPAAPADVLVVVRRRRVDAVVDRGRVFPAEV